MKNKLDKFIKEKPALISIILIPSVLWIIIFSIEYTIGHFIPIQLIGPIAALSGVLIVSYINKIKNT